MTKKEVVVIIFKVICFCSIFVLLLTISSKIFTPLWQDGENSGQAYTTDGLYKEKDNSLDMLFVGDSTMYRGISPMELYDKYGFTSYVYTAPESRICTNYYLIKDALRSQKPKYICIDTATFFRTKKESEEYNRMAYDCMSLSMVKAQMVNDKNFKGGKLDRISYLFPIFRYHSRWNELTSEDFTKLTKDYSCYLKGYKPYKSTKPYNNGFSYLKPTGKKEEIPKRNIEDLDRIVNLCRDNNITLIMASFPDVVDYSYEKLQCIKDYADKNNIFNIDLNRSDYGYDFTVDTYDGGTHANVSGTKKITTEFGKILTEKYKLPNHKNDDKYSKWNDDYKKYVECIK